MAAGYRTGDNMGRRLGRTAGALMALTVLAGPADAAFAGKAKVTSTTSTMTSTTTTTALASDAFNRKSTTSQLGKTDNGLAWVQHSSAGGGLRVLDRRARAVATDETGLADYITNGSVVHAATGRYAVEADFYPSATPNRTAIQMIVAHPGPGYDLINGYGYVTIEMSKSFEGPDADGNYVFPGTNQLYLVAKSPTTTGFHYGNTPADVRFAPGSGPHRIRAELDGQLIRVYANGRLVITHDFDVQHVWDKDRYGMMGAQGLQISAGRGGGGPENVLWWADDLGSSVDNFKVTRLP
jgi:hypothetical protein